MANYGLALAVSPEGEMILLVNRLKLTDLNPGSAGEIPRITSARLPVMGCTPHC